MTPGLLTGWDLDNGIAPIAQHVVRLTTFEERHYYALRKLMPTGARRVDKMLSPREQAHRLMLQVARDRNLL